MMELINLLDSFRLERVWWER